MTEFGAQSGLPRAGRRGTLAADMSAVTPEHAERPILLHVQADELAAQSWQEAIAELAANTAEKAGLPAVQPLIDSALQREDCEPTHLGRGLALPHARVEGLPCAAVYVAHSVAGIAWHKEPAHLIAFLAVPEEAPELYLHLLSRLIRWRLRLMDGALAQGKLPAEAWERSLREELEK